MSQEQNGSRPTDYCDEIVDKTNHYLDNYSDEGDIVPSIEGLAVYLKKARSTIYKWAKEEGKERFSDTLEQILAKQAKLSLNGGLSGDFNATITKLILANHGYSDSSKTDHTSSDGSMTPKKDFNDFYKDN